MMAVETGMRQGEIQALQWKDVDFEGSTIFIKDRKHPTEKARNNQIIPVSNKALQVLRDWGPIKAKRSGAIFPDVKLAQSISDRFVKVRAFAGLPELHFHDFRHEAISRFFEKGLQIQEVARISGHKD
jgi:integrase